MQTGSVARVSTTWIDISMPIVADMPVWPDNAKPHFSVGNHQHGEALITSTDFATNLHSGTHIDAPLHFIEGGAPMSSVSLSSMMGPVQVVDLSGAKLITADLLESRVPDGIERLLMKTDNSVGRIYDNSEFDEGFAALDVSGAEWIADKQLKLVGNDYLSIATFGGDARIHTALMDANVTILEGVVLHHVEPGFYEMMCLPLPTPDTEASLIRALLHKP